MNLKMNFWNQLKMLIGLIIMSLLCFLLIYFVQNSFDLKLTVYLLIPYFLMFFIPVVVIHFNYLNENRGTIFEINQNEIFKKNKTNISKYCTQDIKEIVIYMSGTRNRGNGGLAHSDYFYAKIKLLDGSFFIITSLYSSKIDKILKENFKDVKIATENVFYPMIW